MWASNRERARRRLHGGVNGRMLARSAGQRLRRACSGSSLRKGQQAGNITFSITRPCLPMGSVKANMDIPEPLATLLAVYALVKQLKEMGSDVGSGIQWFRESDTV